MKKTILALLLMSGLFFITKTSLSGRSPPRAAKTKPHPPSSRPAPLEQPKKELPEAEDSPKPALKKDQKQLTTN